MKTLAFAVILAFGPVSAFACPAVPDRSDEVARLLTEVQHAKSEAEARIVTNQLWEIWATAPDETAQGYLDRGMSYRSEYNFYAATQVFTKLIEYCPDYAEGYNQLAFVRFLEGNYAEALPDLEAAIARDPTHVAAIAGQALTLFGLGRMKAGRTVLRQALRLNPWLPERHMLNGFEHEVTPEAPATDL